MFFASAAPRGCDPGPVSQAIVITSKIRITSIRIVFAFLRRPEEDEEQVEHQGEENG